MSICSLISSLIHGSVPANLFKMLEPTIRNDLSLNLGLKSSTCETSSCDLHTSHTITLGIQSTLNLSAVPRLHQFEYPSP